MKSSLIHQFLNNSIEKYPDKIAVEDSNSTITYRMLNDKSDYLSKLFLENNIREEKVVGVFMNKSINSIISFLGILKSGGAYIPFDNYYSPMNRVKKIIYKSKVNIIITDNKNFDKISKALKADEITIGKKIKLINIDKISYSSKNNFNIDIKVDKNDLAYVLYTSGSTGTPKGVMISHLNATTFINWSISYFKPSKNDIFSNFASFTFDLSVFDIYVSLACGAKLCILPFELSNNPRWILKWICEKNITFMYTVPSVWINLINYTNLKNTKMEKLSKVLFAGEVFHPKYLKELMISIPKASFYNLYGPTETNVCTYYDVQNINEIKNKPIPIGKACGDIKTLVINEENTEVSIGCEGELIVSGDIVSKGYYLDEINTYKSFIKNPVDKNDKRIFYKTGDIVKKLNDNNYEYINRKDNMVKHAGFRIELIEIENVILNYATVREVVVISITDEKKIKNYLCAVIEVTENKKLSVVDLKEYIGEKIPKYMIPEVIINIDKIPKNLHGKIDRQKINDFVKSSLKMN
ncbi:MAG: amino acid adenylation domain-containing protein [Clostridiales bacterium]